MKFPVQTKEYDESDTTVCEVLNKVLHTIEALCLSCNAAGYWN